MRRSVLIVTLVIALPLFVAGAYYGPQLVAGYHFMSALEATDAESQANGEPWPQIHDTCTLCHGSKGQSSNAQYAALAGQSANYLEAQLHAFADGKRGSPLMHPLAAALTDAQISSLASYFSRQHPTTTEVDASDGYLAQSGRDLVEAKGCSGCHGANLEGGPLAPRIGGLGDRYLIDQITAFKQGRRVDPTNAMNTLAASLSDQEITALVHFVASKKPTAGNTQSK